MVPRNRGVPVVVRWSLVALTVIALLASPTGMTLRAQLGGSKRAGDPSPRPTVHAGALPPEVHAKIDPTLLDELLAQDGASSPRLEPAAGAPTTYLVYLEDEAPLAGLSLPPERDARRRAVVDRLRERAEVSQRGVLAVLSQHLASGSVARTRRYWIANVIVVEGDLEAAVALALLPEVVALEPNRTIQLTLPEVEAASPAAPAIAWGVDRIDAERVWAEFGIRGQGIVVANMDSGVDWTHPDLRPKYRGYNAANPAASDHNYNWFDFTGTYPEAPGPRDTSGSYVTKIHGTHVMGTMVGSSPDGGTIVGVAPGAQWIAVKVFDDSGKSTTTAIRDGLQWVLAPTDLNGENPDPSMAPDVVCNSWGDDGTVTIFEPDVAALRAAGIITVFSAGNSGGEDGAATIDAPASYTNTLAIGATDSADSVAGFSSRGPSPWGQIKPDVVAPGVSVVSTIPGGGYGTLSGTSMAAPHAAGALALMLEADRRVLGVPTMTVTTTESILRDTAVDLGDAGPDNTYGYGRVDAHAAVHITGGFTRIVVPLVFRRAPMVRP